MKPEQNIISEEKYMDFVQRTFLFLTEEFNYSVGNKKANGNIFYDINFEKEDSVISISLETLQDYLLVILFKLENGQLPRYDDKAKTIHLNRFTETVIKNNPDIDFLENNLHFKEISPSTEIEKLILKNAKELRICLKYS
ncbi:hypothetical protein [Flavobacterium sp.]|uniref:hypothetical protein n=1 Tax=Flavobacterium sp. TaxID=239 RepID=UPI0039E4C51E